MAAIQWGRKETIIFPPHNPIYSYGAVFLALVLTAFFTFLRFSFGQLPLSTTRPFMFARPQVGPSTRRTSSNCSMWGTERKQSAWQPKTTCRKARRPRREERTFRSRYRERPKRKAIGFSFEGRRFITKMLRCTST
jgi:hypothetical protein